MSDSDTLDIDDERVRDALRRAAEAVEHSCPAVVVPAPQVLRRKKAKRATRRAVLGSGVAAVVVVLGALIAVHTTGTVPGSSATGAPGPHSPATTRLPLRPVLAVSPSINLDIVSAADQVSVNLASGSIERSPGLVNPAAAGTGVAIAFARSGYIVGYSSTGDGYVSVSDDLQRVLHVWPGAGPAPAADPSDVWLSTPFADPSVAQEFNERQQAVGPAVGIPTDTIVQGQIGTDLILVGAPPAQTLELWNPISQTMVATLGPFDQVATTSTELAWTSGATVHLVAAAGSAPVTVDGPAGDWATSLAFSPAGSQVAVVWAPAPGSLPGATRATIEAHSTMAVVDVAAADSTIVPGSAGAVGPAAWTADGTRLFFGQSVGSPPTEGARHVVISTYRLGSVRATALSLPDVTLPDDFGASTGSLIVWKS
jgi:hypothetical protein